MAERAGPAPRVRVAVVTGSGRGIGRAVALRLDQAGYRLALTARSRHELDEVRALCSGDAMVVVGDLTDAGFPDRLIDRVEADLGPVAVLVANAGASRSALVTDTTDEDLQAMLELNLVAPFRLLRRVLGGMTAQGFGRVVVVASVLARIGATHAAAYAASKHGVLGLVRSAALECAENGVTVNAVCPGWVDTTATDENVAHVVGATGRPVEEVRAVFAAKQPIGRLLTPDEVAEAVMLCVEASGMNGQALNVDGGAVLS